MIGEITAGFETLMEQASMTVDTYLSQAVKRIDTEFGKGLSAAPVKSTESLEYVR
jgi:hypothetical protein